MTELAEATIGRDRIASVDRLIDPYIRRTPVVISGGNTVAVDLGSNR